METKRRGQRFPEKRKRPGSSGPLHHRYKAELHKSKFCACGCGTAISEKALARRSRFIRGHYNYNPYNPALRVTRLCECGCGIEIPAFIQARSSRPRRFVQGHHYRGQRNPAWNPELHLAKFCECGCGKEIPAKVGSRRRHFVLGHQCRGKRHWNYQHGQGRQEAGRQTKQYREWRDAVYRRDRWRCRFCGKKCQKGNIAADHIHPFAGRPALRYKVSNGRTLCRRCHATRHRLGTKLRVA